MNDYPINTGDRQDSRYTIPNFSQLTYQQIRHQIKHYETYYPDATRDNRFRFFLLLNESDKRHKPNLFRPGYVYLMYDYMKDVYKIGQSISPKQRRDQLDPSLEIVCQIKTDSMRQLENSLHSLFIGKRIKRGNQLEWFALDPADVRFIMSLQGAGDD